VGTSATHIQASPSVSTASEVSQKNGKYRWLPYTIDLLFAFCAAGFTFGWSVSGFAPNIILACTCWTVTLLAVLDLLRRYCNHFGKKKTKWSILTVLPVVVVWMAWKPVVNQYRVQHSPPPTNETEQKILRILEGKPKEDQVRDTEINAFINAGLSDSVSPAERSLAILEVQQEQLSSDREKLSRAQQSIVEPTNGVGSLRLKEAADKAMEENAKQLADNQARQDAIKASMAQKSDEIAKIKKDEQVKLENQRFQQNLADQCVEVFSYSITGLHDDLANYSRDTREVLTQTNRAIFSHELIPDETAVVLTNLISLGTNDGWKFQIVITPATSVQRFSSRGSVLMFNPPKMDILNESKDWKSALHIEPILSKSMQRKIRYMQTDDFRDASGPFAIKLKVSEVTVFHTNVDFSNYKAGVDAGVLALLEKLDLCFPLKTNAP
jgi:predicted subunit of tRNA(5-methylaminomethyl-2-thiouridylate) methyltransferase